VIVVLDTNVLVAGLRSRRGASFQVLARVGTGAFDVAVSVPLVLEYEDALLRNLPATGLVDSDIGDIVDYICSVARRHSIFFLWRPLLRDPKDDMIAEVAIAAGCDAIVTFNRRDFTPVAAFGLQLWTPAELLRRIEVSI
jgi:predicted nucleic acid-binding protein